ncbi:hypothetical protein [Paenibacillus thermotolerans]|uniref:hypothetical protein n=1 Tax=Paenibacillus thermotolerans TaxID=3027807 RepID=UPI00236745A8|nr:MULTISPECIES: hypothetical protein [unclassified Paenibacillus]
MKVSFQGKVKLQGQVKMDRKAKSTAKTPAKAKPAPKPASKPAQKPSLQAIRRAVRLEMNRGIHRMERNLRALRVGIRRDVRRELYSPRFANMIRDAVNGFDELREQANRYLNQNVIITTTAGPISGTLIRVGASFMVVRETDSTLLIVPFGSTASIRPQ